MNANDHPLSRLSRLSTPALKRKFNRPRPDYTKERTEFIATVKTDIEAIDDGEGLLFATKNGVVKFTLPFRFNGSKEHYIEDNADVRAFLDCLLEAAEDGFLDEALGKRSGSVEWHGNGAPVEQPVKKKRAGWSDERRAAFAAKKAAK